MEKQNNNLDDCTHVAPKGEFKAGKDRDKQLKNEGIQLHDICKKLNEEELLDFTKYISTVKKQGMKEANQRILRFIETERDNGNIEMEVNCKKGQKGFSASLCLSKLMKMLGESNTN